MYIIEREIKKNNNKHYSQGISYHLCLRVRTGTCYNFKEK